MQHPTTVRMLLLMMLLASSFAASDGWAQTIPIGEQIAFEMTPRVPAPEQLVTVSATSYSFDMTRATLVWTLNGKEIERGLGKSSVTFTTGRAGSTVRLHVAIAAPNGTSISRDVVFTVGDLSVIVEASTYTPPFYRGRPLPTRGAEVRLVAIPSIPGFGIDDFSFNWEREYEPIASASGVGRNALTAKAADIDEAVTLSVEAISLDGSVRVRKDVDLTAAAPEVVFYEENPLRGVLYERAVPQATTLAGKEVTYVAEPYFFSVRRRDDARLTYEWLLNGAETQVAAAATLTLRQDVEGEGAAYIELSVQNVREIFQNAAAAFSLAFGQRTE